MSITANKEKQTLGRIRLVEGLPEIICVILSFLLGVFFGEIIFYMLTNL